MEGSLTMECSHTSSYLEDQSTISFSSSSGDQCGLFKRFFGLSRDTTLMLALYAGFTISLMYGCTGLSL